MFKFCNDNKHKYRYLPEFILKWVNNICTFINPSTLTHRDQEESDTSWNPPTRISDCLQKDIVLALDHQYNENKTAEEMYEIIEIIEKYLLINDFENAFCIFLLQTKRLNSVDRDILIIYFNEYFTTKYVEKNKINPIGI